MAFRVPDEYPLVLEEQRRKKLMADDAPDNFVAMRLVDPSCRQIAGVDKGPHIAVSALPKLGVDERKELDSNTVLAVFGGDEIVEPVDFVVLQSKPQPLDAGVCEGGIDSVVDPPPIAHRLGIGQGHEAAIAVLQVRGAG